MLGYGYGNASGVGPSYVGAHTSKLPLGGSVVRHTDGSHTIYDSSGNNTTNPSAGSGAGTQPVTTATPAAQTETANQTSQRLAAIRTEMEQAGYTNLSIVGSGPEAAVRGIKIKDGVTTESTVSKTGMV